MRRRGSCLTPFAPQRIVTATRAHRSFYRRPRAPPLRPRASVREMQGLATRGAGLAARLHYGKDRARPEGAEAAVRGSGGGGKGRRTAEEGELGGAREGCGVRRGAAQRRRSIRPPWRGSCAILPRPVRPAETLHRTPPPLGALPGLRRRAGRGRSLQSGWGMLLAGPERRPVPFG